MKPAERILNEARGERDPKRSDGLAVRAICLDPGFGAAYAVRARLAAHRGDAVVAAHHFRAAFARGDRSPETRVGLSICLAVAGQVDLASRVRAQLLCPSSLVDFEELARNHGRPIRQVLSARMPPDDEPALLPGERIPADLKPPTKATVLEVASTPPVRSLPKPRGFATEPPLPAATVAVAARVTRQGGDSQPAWLENIDRSQAATRPGGPVPDWLEGMAPSVEAIGGPRIDTSGRLELVTDPGQPTVLARSPITGQVDDPRDLERHYRGTAVGEFGSRADALEARADFGRDAPSDFLVAVRLPGPVMTAVGAAPKKLAQWMAIGLTTTEMVMRDIESDTARLVRLPLGAVTVMEIVGDGQQISLTLADGRQLHLDLRNLRARAFRAAVLFVNQLTAALA